MSNDSVARLLSALIILLLAAQGFGALFQRMRQPRAIGEIIGGLALGPSLLGLLAPGVESWLFPKGSTTSGVLGAVSQIGLLLLMFCSGAEIRRVFERGQTRLLTTIAATGIIIPFFAGVLALQLVSLRGMWGTAGNYRSFLLVFATAIAVTSIPVISRIMHDLGILKTPFARVVLGVAVVEDVVLYVVLAIAVGLSAGSGAVFGLPRLLALRPGSAADIAYHVTVTIGVLALFLVLAQVLRSGRLSGRGERFAVGNPVTIRVLFLFAVALLCVSLGVENFLGAFVAGIVLASIPGADRASGHSAVLDFSFAFFIPLYFALVGVSLNLRHGFNALFFLAFLTFACVVKAASVYLGARLGGSRGAEAVNLAVAMNARGGPGIVLASVSYNAHLISEGFFASLVLLSVVTSLVAGSWLERVPQETFLAQERTDDVTPPAVAVAGG